MSDENGCEPVWESGDLSGRVDLLLADIRALEMDREDLLRELGEWRNLSALRLAGLLHSAFQGRLGSWQFSVFADDWVRLESFKLDSGESFRPASDSGQLLLWACGDVLNSLKDKGRGQP